MYLIGVVLGIPKHPKLPEAELNCRQNAASTAMAKAGGWQKVTFFSQKKVHDGPCRYSLCKRRFRVNSTSTSGWSIQLLKSGLIDNIVSYAAGIWIVAHSIIRQGANLLYYVFYNKMANICAYSLKAIENWKEKKPHHHILAWAWLCTLKRWSWNRICLNFSMSFPNTYVELQCAHYWQ